MGTTSVQKKTLCLTSDVANGLEPKELLWQQRKGVSDFVSYVMHICGAKFQERCFNISRDLNQ